MTGHAAAAAIALPVAAILLMGATPPGPPWPEVVSRDAITLRWYPDDTSQAEAQSVAEAHCAPTNRHAALAAIEQNGSITIATWRCR